MIDRTVISSTAGDYELERAKNKLGVMAMIVIFIKSTIGLAIFGYHEVYEKSGVGMGLILSVIFIYTVTHGSMRMVTFADEVESNTIYKGYHIDTYFGRRSLTQN